MAATKVANARMEGNKRKKVMAKLGGSSWVGRAAKLRAWEGISTERNSRELRVASDEGETISN